LTPSCLEIIHFTITMATWVPKPTRIRWRTEISLPRYRAAEPWSSLLDSVHCLGIECLEFHLTFSWRLGRRGIKELQKHLAVTFKPTGSTLSDSRAGRQIQGSEGDIPYNLENRVTLAIKTRKYQPGTCARAPCAVSYLHLYRTQFSKAGVFKLYLLKGHILMAERFAGRIHVLQSKVCILLQDTPTSISLHKHTQHSLFIYLFI
jgi:hypothetical protein